MSTNQPMRCASCGEATPPLDACAHCGGDPRLRGRYRLLAQVGRGAQGVTWRAWDEQAARTVAIKEQPLHSLDHSLAARVEREARVLRELSHPQIPAYVDDFVVRNGRQVGVHIVQSFVEGASLRDEIEHHRYTEAEVVALLDDVAGVLAYLHGLAPPVIHRDLKPGNLIRRPEGGIALVDFGSVRDALVDPTLGGSTMTGTYGYAAPEQFLGHADARTDLYALGVLAVTLLSRREPLSMMGTGHRLVWQPHVQCSAGLRALLEALLQAEPAARPADAATVRARLAALGGAAPSGAVEAGFGRGLTRLDAVPVVDAAAPDLSVTAAAQAFAAADTALFDRIQAAYRAEDGDDDAAKAAAWRAVAEHDGAPPEVVGPATERLRDWTRRVEAAADAEARLQAAWAAFVADEVKLGQLLGYDDRVVPPAQKAAYRAEFEATYAPWYPVFEQRWSLHRPTVGAEATDARPAMVVIPAGTFLMGSPDDDGYDDERPQRRVTIPAFWMAATPVTQAQYRAVTGRSPSKFTGKDDHPVEMVSWDDAVDYCNALSALEGLPPAYARPWWRGRQRTQLPGAVGYRLPSEAEWEYACRAGTTTTWWTGDDEAALQQAAWFGEGGDGTRPVARKRANRWGLYDVHGNVWEWCEDWYGPYGEAPTDGSARSKPAQLRVRRGGSWLNTATNLRAANRAGGSPGDRLDRLGFRVARATP